MRPPNQPNQPTYTNTGKRLRENNEPRPENCQSEIMTAIQIQRRIMFDRYRRSFVLPNYTPLNWFECDVFEITKAGYFVEYEIKVSVEDFKADAEKRRSSRWRYVQGQVVSPSTDKKHDLISSASDACPSRFFYCAPEGVLDKSDIPPWAGLLEFWDEKRQIPFCKSVINAPTIHRRKPDAKILEHARSVVYYRMHNLFIFRRLGMGEVKI